MAKQQLQVNALPVPTWNHLGVNRSNLALEAAGNPLLALPEPFQAIATGMGREAENAVLQRAAQYALITATTAQQEPQSARYVLDAANPTLADVTLIHAKAGSRVTVLRSYLAGDESACLHMGLTKILAEAGAQVRLVQVQLLNSASTHFDDVGVLLDEGATVEVVQAELGAGADFAGCLALLQGRGSNFAVDTAYFGDKGRQLDFNYVARHSGKKTSSEMHAAGALFDDSGKIYRGTIDFLRGASRATGHEGEQTLLFSPSARCRTVPLILCGEEDVEGQHAASIGKVDAARLFYLQSRGLSETQAKRLLIEAQLAPVLEKVPDEELRAQISAYLERRMQLD